MRHRLTTRYVVVATIVLLLGSAAFAGLANVTDAEDEDRVEAVQDLPASVDRGRELFLEVACASCHGLSDAGVAGGDGGPSLDDGGFTVADTIRSLIGGTVPAHDDEGYEHTLSNQQMADLAAYLDAVTE